MSSELGELSRCGGAASKYIPWMQASYILAVNKKPLEWLPSGADVNALTHHQDAPPRPDGTLARDMVSGMSKHLRTDIQAAVAKMSMTMGGGRELRKLPDHLHEGERVDLIATGAYEDQLATGIVVLTNQRLMFMKDGVLFKGFEDFPLDKITSVQWSSGPLSGTITVFASGNQAVITELEKPDGLAICDAVRARLTKPPRPSVDGDGSAAKPDVLDQLAKLGELHSAGVLTDTEFTAKKAELLGRI